MSKTIPACVTADQLLESLGPFFELMGITKNHVYATPGISIRDSEVTFVVPAVPEKRWGKGRPSPELPREPFYPQVGKDNQIAENMLSISVEVLR